MKTLKKIYNWIVITKNWRLAVVGIIVSLIIAVIFTGDIAGRLAEIALIAACRLILYITRELK